MFNNSAFDSSGRLNVAVRMNEDNAFWCSRPCGFGSNRMLFGTRLFSNDIVGHEFGHGVVQAVVPAAPGGTGGFARGGEPGALNEHYGDVLGNLAFPDNNSVDWKVGEESTMGAVRDMRNPGLLGHPAHYGLMTTVCSDPESCVHSWAGIPNRAAVLIAEGGIVGSNHSGVGRPTLAQLYMRTLRTLGCRDLFLNERVGLIATCRGLRNTTISGRTVTNADCDHVARALDTVGVQANTEYGWSRFATGLFGSATEVQARTGLSLYNGCTMANQIVRGVDPSGTTKTSDTANGLTINFNDEWGAYVTQRGSATDPRAEKWDIESGRPGSTPAWWTSTRSTASRPHR